MANTKTLSLALANLLLPVAVLIFATGFFPYKPFLPGLATFETQNGVLPEARFDKLIFMVVDALRSDFVYSGNSGFDYVQSLIRSGDAIPFTAHATSPTITMPRVKAITTGSIPSFLDVILNFAESDTTSTLAGQDTWLAQIKEKKDAYGENGKLIMYGDDTWLKLFPGMFERADGTTSFFVSDFTEVDNNVTRHVPGELQNTDWNAMIMHYLGLDHIGHKAGPLSPNMIPKQKEMDGIVHQIYQAMTTKAHLSSTLFVLLGDHGMNDGGNHGGSAPGETSPALVFMSPQFRQLNSQGLPAPITPEQDFDFYAKIEQSDVAPTIAGLMGVPISLNNLGVFLRPFLHLWGSENQQVDLLMQNARQMLNIVRATFPDEDYEGPSDLRPCRQSSSGAQLACLWRKAREARDGLGIEGEISPANQVLQDIYEFCHEAQDVMSSTASNYDVTRLVVGIVIASIAMFSSLLSIPKLTSLTNSTGMYYCLVTALYAVMMFASSYIEEEQHFWYWMTSGWLGLLYATKSYNIKSTENRKQDSWLVSGSFALHRIVTRWNQTGQKHAGASDIVKDYLLAYPLLLWMSVLATFAVVAIGSTRHFSDHYRIGFQGGAACSTFLVLATLIFKLAFTASDAPELLTSAVPGLLGMLHQIPLVASARLVFVMLTSFLAWALYRNRINQREDLTGRKSDVSANMSLVEMLLFLLTVFLITQSKIHNAPLYLIFLFQLTWLQSLKLTPLQVTLTTILLAHVSFFALGNSNAISSIDLSNAYNGVSGYNVLAVGVLVFASNWAGPIWWAVGGMLLLVSAREDVEGKTMQATNDVLAAQGGRAKATWIEEERTHLAKKAQAPTANSSAATSEKSSLAQHLSLLSLFTTTSLLAIMVACTMLRTHLFIWTVFSPKYLYAMAWTLAFHLLISVGINVGIWSAIEKQRR